jgi:hypothetical protein
VVAASVKNPRQKNNKKKHDPNPVKNYNFYSVAWRLTIPEEDDHLSPQQQCEIDEAQTIICSTTSGIEGDEEYLLRSHVTFR